MSSLTSLIAFCALVQTPQEPSEARVKLVRELEQKLEALGPVSFGVVGETWDAKGTKLVELTGRFYMNLADSVFHFVALKKSEGGEEGELHMFGVLGDFALMGSKSDFTLGIFGSRLRRIARKDFDVANEVNAFFGKPPKYRDFHGRMAAIRSMIQLEVAAKPDDPEMTECTIRLGSSDNVSASWLKDALAAPGDAVRLREGEVELFTGPPRKRILVDPQTGFLKSLRVELANGASGQLKVTRVERCDVRPDIRYPGKVEAKPMSSAEAIPGQHAKSLLDSLPAFRKRLVEEGAVAGADAKAEALRDLLTNLAIAYESNVREAVHRRLTAQVTNAVVEKGRSLDDISREIEGAAKGLKSVIEKSEAEGRADIDKIAGTFKDKMLDTFREAPKEIAEKVALRIQEAFEPGRLAKARASRPPPEPLTLLRDEIVDSIELASAPARLATRVREWQARRLTELVAQAGAFSCKLTVESSEDDPDKARVETDFHWRPEEGCAYSVIFKTAKEGGRTLFAGSEYRLDGKVRSWKGDQGWQIDFAPAMDSVWRLAWDREVEFARLMERPPAFASMESYRASFNPVMLMRLAPGRPGTEHSNMGLGALLHPDGNPSWIGDFREADAVEFLDAGTAKFGTARQSTLIDLKSGFPIWFRNDFGPGKFKILRIAELKPRAPKPELPVRPALRESVMPPEFKAAEAGSWLWETMEEDIPRILQNWDRLGSEKRAEDVRRYFSTAAAWNRACYADIVRMHNAVDFVELAVKAGKSLDDLAGGVDSLVPGLAKKMEAFERASIDKYKENDQKLKSRLVAFIGHQQAPFETRRALAHLVNDAFEPDRVAAVRLDRPAPDYKQLIRASIHNARRKTEE